MLLLFDISVSGDKVTQTQQKRAFLGNLKSIARSVQSRLSNTNYFKLYLPLLFFKQHAHGLNRPSNVPCKKNCDQVPNKKVHAAIADAHGQRTEVKVVWPQLKVIWLSKDDYTGHGDRKKEVYRRSGGMDFAGKPRAAQDGIRWKGIVVTLSIVPQRPCKFR